MEYPYPYAEQYQYQYEPQYEDDEEVGEDQLEDQGDAADEGIDEAEAAGVGPGSYTNKEREEAERRARCVRGVWLGVFSSGA